MVSDEDTTTAGAGDNSLNMVIDAGRIHGGMSTGASSMGYISPGKK